MIKAVIFDMYETLITLYESPLYFSTQMAVDAGISEEKFQSLWKPREHERTVGKMTLEEILEFILKEKQCYSDELFSKIVGKRKISKKECFKYLHPEILPMLNELKKKGICIGLISNCFSEEVEAIKSSELFPYFDVTYLSFEQGLQKPEKEIFIRCMDDLSVSADECIYVGDGGSLELEAASQIGMKAVQAVWYLKEGTIQPSRRKKDFIQAETPFDILKYI
ncbi:MAG: HAD-IA family hydrolase [Clostridium sp.]|nr:HAD-IA family hydrolase [Clostridium sp.]MDU7084985.1 HAD-IA family hydrolase [Clostridium sp.]